MVSDAECLGLAAHRCGNSLSPWAGLPVHREDTIGNFDTQGNGAEIWPSFYILGIPGSSSQ